MQNRNQKGQFQNKSESERKVRSIRATDNVWQKLGEIAKQQGITRADLLEEIIKNNRVLHSNNSQVIHGNIENIKLLEEALKLKANAGGAIKKKIHEYLKSIYL